MSYFCSFDPFLIIPTNIVFDSPANAEAAGLYRDNMKEYIRRVKLTVEESWMDPPDEAASGSKGPEAAAATTAVTAS
jgi:hypothetical protein